MSKQQHTPGPWGIIIGDAGPIVFSGDRGRMIATSAKQITSAEREANARLIAAAPDLLDALAALASSAPSACCADFHHQPGDYHDAGEACPALDRYEAACLAARRAIAKARGES